MRTRALLLGLALGLASGVEAAVRYGGTAWLVAPRCQVSGPALARAEDDGSLEYEITGTAGTCGITYAARYVLNITDRDGNGLRNLTHEGSPYFALSVMPGDPLRQLLLYSGSEAMARRTVAISVTYAPNGLPQVRVTISRPLAASRERPKGLRRR